MGKIYSSSDLAYYNRGQQFPNFIVNNINSSIDSVLFPVMSSVQDERGKVKNMTIKSIKVSVYVMAPLMMGLAFTAESVVRLVLTDKWLACIPFLRIFSITYMFYPIHTANLNAIKAMGRSDLFLKLEIIKKGVGLILMISSIQFGVLAMAYSMLLGNVISQVINSWPNRKLLGYSYADQIKDILPSILLAVFMGICVYMVTFFNLSSFITLCIQMISGALIYIISSAVFKMDSFLYLWNLLKTVIHR